MTACISERPKVYELQICNDYVYALEDLLCDTIYQNKLRIAEIRKIIGHFVDQDKTTQMLAEIQAIEGRKVILQELFDQLIEQGL